MSREEYLQFVFDEHANILKREHRDELPGTTVIFSGFYGRAYYQKQEDGTWTREVH